jgi:hypothetical protein
LKVSKTLISAVAVILFALPALADNVNFNSFTTTTCFLPGGTLDTQGAHFTTGTPASAGADLSNQLFVCGGMRLDNDLTNSLINANGPSDVVMSLIDGSAFTLTNFDAGTRTTDFDPTSPTSTHNSLGVTVTGTFANGSGTVTFNFNFNGLDWTTFTPAGFSGLSSVEFIAYGDSPGPENALDNIGFTRDISLETPEPTGLLLLGSGFLGVVGTLRRRFA